MRDAEEETQTHVQFARTNPILIHFVPHLTSGRNRPSQSFSGYISQLLQAQRSSPSTSLTLSLAMQGKWSRRTALDWIR
jgi:hypothetical protein